MNSNATAIRAILNKLKIKDLNAMQEISLETIASTDNVLLLSATGTGKTLAFLLPLLQECKENTTGSKVLIIVPSRELALQIELVFKSMGTGIKITCCYGGHKRETEENNLTEAPAIIVGTPGRLADHIRRGNITTATINTLVLDEFDKSLELGFQDEMSFIVKALPAIKKKILTSATEASQIPPFIEMGNLTKLDFLLEGEKDTGLAVQWIQSKENDKLETLFNLLCFLGNRSTIIFCNHRESVERTSNWLKEKDIVNVFYHGAMEQQQRDIALCKFKNGTANVLVTTDLASRGLDIANIRYIIHYHLPATADVFTHRNGRTARMDASGTAILILSPEEKLPTYLETEPEAISLPAKLELPEKPFWSTLFVSAGKKDKINKVDILGFLMQKGQLKKEDIGLIDVKDFFSFVAIKKIKLVTVLQKIKDHKMKNKKVQITVAK